MGNSNYEGVAEKVQLVTSQRLKQQMTNAMQVANKIGMNETRALDIVSLNVWQIVDKLNDHSLTSLQLVLAVVLRTGKIGKQMCYITQTNFTYAIDNAKKCDQIRKSSKKSNWTFQSHQQFNQSKYLPPLFGVPISIKDTFNMDGFSSTVGLLSRVNVKFEQSPFILAFKNSGIIPFVRSNTPQLGMAVQSMNSIWGRSLNPWNKDRAVGGSSGGQGGLISSRCSILGLGSDIGGSLRAPADHCGIFSIKPYSKRFSSTYHTKFSDAFNGSAQAIPLCLGPMAKSTQDLALFMKSATHLSFFQNKFDPYVKNEEFDQKIYNQYINIKRKLRIGVVKSLKDVQPTKASARALKQTQQLLKSLGHECIQIQIPNQKEIIRQFFTQNLCTGGETFREILAGEKPAKQYDSLFQIAQMFSPTRAVAKVGVSATMPRLHYYLFEKGGVLSAFKYQNHIGLIQNYKLDWVKYWRENQLDFVICPGFGCQALLHGKSEKTSLVIAYTLIWNVLDFVACSLPVTVVRPDEQKYESAFDDMLTTELQQNCQKSEGLPVGIQLIAMPYEQEKALGFMNLLERQIKFYKNHPLPTIS